MTQFKKYTPIVFLVLLLASLTIACKRQSQYIRNLEPYKLGFIAPLTGDASSYGLAEKNVVELALKEINKKNGINGRRLEIIFDDGLCTGKDASSALQKLINIDQVKVVLGGVCSGETLAMAPIAEQNKTIIFSSFSTNPNISQAGDFVFRNAPSDKDVAESVAEVVYRDNQKQAAILSENTDYAIGLQKNIEKKLELLNVNIVAIENYPQGSKDLRTQLLKIRDSKSTALIINSQGGISGGLAVKQAEEIGLEVDYYGTIDIGSGDSLKAGGQAMNGLKFTDMPGLNKNNPKAQEFLEKYLELYPQPPSNFQIGARYDSVYILKQAIEACSDVNTECIRDYLYDMEDYDGVIGKYHFDENGDPVGFKTFTVKQIVDAETGEIVEIE